MKGAGKLREAKPGGFQTGGVRTFFGKGPDCVADPFGTVPRRCSYLNRPRKRKGTNRENPQSIPEQIGKIPEKSGKSQRTKKGQKRKDKSRSGSPPFETPLLAPLEKVSYFVVFIA